MNALAGNWDSLTGGGARPLEGELSTNGSFAPPPKKGRRAERVPVELGAGLRQRGASGVSVQIMDLSTDGFRVATHLDLCTGTDVWLRLPGLEPCHSRVMWTQGHYVGCAFVRPLHPAVLDMVIAKSHPR